MKKTIFLSIIATFCIIAVASAGLTFREEIKHEVAQILANRIMEEGFGSAGEEVDEISISAVTGSTDVTFITDTTDDFAVGGNDSSAAFFVDESTGNVRMDGTLTPTGLSTFAGFISTASSTVDASLNITGNTTSTNATTTGSLYITKDLLVGDTASSTTSLNTQGSMHAGINITADGEITSTGSTTASIINMTTVKFTPSATPTPDVQGECFMSSAGDSQVKCFDGTAWQELW